MLSSIEKQIVNILFLSGEEISLDKIPTILSLGEDDFDIYKFNFENIIKSLEDIGLKLLKDNDKLKIVTSSEYSKILESFTNYEYNSDLSPAALQVITIISYMGESSDADISFIRGVQSSQILRSLTTRGLLKRDENKYSLTLEAYQILGVENHKNLPEYDNLSFKIKEKLKDSLNG
jgi:segregation and condensation protein B